MKECPFRGVESQVRAPVVHGIPLRQLVTELLVPLAASHKQCNGQNGGQYCRDSFHYGCKGTNKIVFARFSSVKFCRLGIRLYPIAKVKQVVLVSYKASFTVMEGILY
jgi:hypothetical protein